MTSERNDHIRRQGGDSVPSAGAIDSDLIRAAIQAETEAEVPDASSDARPCPERIGPYRIVSVLGRGGMGLVYEAEQDHPRRAVALKVVRGERYVDQNYVRLFQREAQTLARLKHPSVASIYEAGCTDDGHHYFAMELVRGMSLRQYVRKKRLDASGRLNLFCKICDAINYAHQRGVIHRDLKPSNILIQSDGQPKVLDFGLARISNQDIAVATVVTEVGRIQGTLPYMSPEQARGNPDEIDLRSDVYSLGVILYEMLTDRLPHELMHTVLHEAVRAICEDPPPRPSGLNRTLRGDLETILLKTLEKEPERRYQSAAALSEDIERFLHKQPILARPPSTLYHLRKLVARHKAGSFVVLAFFLVISGFGIWMRVLATRAADEAETAKQVSQVLLDLFEAPDPNVARGDAVTVREVLDRGVQRIQLLDNRPELRATLMHTLGDVYRNLGLYDQAARLHQDGVNLRMQTLGPAHRLVSKSHFRLGWALKQTGAYAAAETSLRQALDLNVRHFGEISHPVAVTLRMLGATNRDQGDYTDAEVNARRALDIFRSLPGNQDREVSESLETLATILEKRGQYRQAYQLLEDARELRRRALPGDHPHHESITERMIPVLRALGSYTEAEALVRTALDERIKTHGPDHTYVGSLYYWLGQLRLDQGDFPGAENHLHSARNIYRPPDRPDDEKLSAGHPLVARLDVALGWVRFEQGDLAGAQAQFAAATNAYRARRGAMHPTMAESMLGQAHVKLAQEEFDEARKLASTVYESLRNALHEEHWLTASAEGTLGECLLALSQFAEAEHHLAHSLEAMRMLRGHDDRYVLLAVERLMQLFERTNNEDKARQVRELLQQHGERTHSLRPG